MSVPGETAHGQTAHEVAAWVPPLARMGYAAKGLVYLLVGITAFRTAFTIDSPEGAKGVLRSLVDETGGQLLLFVIAAGLAGHVIWRLVQALLDPEHTQHDFKHIALRVFYFMSALIYGSVAWTAWELARGHTWVGDDDRVWLSHLMALPAGRWLVIGVGIGIMVYGVHQLIKAIRGTVTKRLSGHDRRIRTIGRIGTGARGVVLLPIGWLVFSAGRHYDPGAVTGTEGALLLLERGGLLAAIGIGLAAYGVFQMAKAVYRSIQPPA